MARPKRQFSDEEMQKIEECAHNNCHMDTIALALDIPLTTLVRRFGRVIRQKRAEGRIELRANQSNLAKTSADMCKFLGVNVLGQEIKQTVKTEPVKQTMTSQEQKASEAAAKIYKLRMAQGQAG